MTHTPGPNTAIPSDHLGDPAWAVRCHDGDLLAVGCLRGDALLYAAAPELLDAAKLALEVAESHIRSEYEGTSMLNALWAELDPVRAAIAKAEGETK